MANDLSLNRMASSSADAARNRLLGMKSGVGTYRHVAPTEQFSNHPKVDLKSHDTVSFNKLRFGGSLHPVVEKDTTDRKNLTWRQKALPVAGKVGVMLAASLVGGLLGGIVGAFLAAAGAGAALTALGYQKVAKPEPTQTATPPTIWPQSQAAQKSETTPLQTPHKLPEIVADAANTAKATAQKAATKLADAAEEPLAETTPESPDAKPSEKPAPTLVPQARPQSPFQSGKALTPAFGSLQAQIIRAAIANSSNHAPKMAGNEPQVDTTKTAPRLSNQSFLPLTAPLTPVVAQVSAKAAEVPNPFQSVLPDTPTASAIQPMTLMPGQTEALPSNSQPATAAGPQAETLPSASAPEATLQPAKPQFGMITAGARFGRLTTHKTATPEHIATLKQNAMAQALPLHNLKKPVATLHVDFANRKLTFGSVSPNAKTPVIVERQIPHPKLHSETPKAELLAT